MRSQYWKSSPLILESAQGIDSLWEVLFGPFGNGILRHIKNIHDLHKSFLFTLEYYTTKSAKDFPIPSILFHFVFDILCIFWREGDSDFIYTPIIYTVLFCQVSIIKFIK
jgi:hypothetical protein